MNPPELIWTEQDTLTLDCYRIERLRAFFPVLQGCGVSILGEQLERSLILSCSCEQFEQVKEHLEVIRDHAWVICATSSLSCYRDYKLVCTIEGGSLSQDLTTLGNQTLFGNPNMIAAQEILAKLPLSQMSQTNQITQTENDLKVPQLISIKTLAERAGLNQEAIASQIIQLGGVAGFDPAAGEYKATEDHAALWADQFIEQRLQEIRERERAALLGLNPSTTDDATAQAPPRARRSVKRSEEIVTPPEEKKVRVQPPRFKPSKRSNSQAGTIGKFLDAQGYSDTQRIELIEAIAALPAPPPASRQEWSLADHALNQIMKVHASNPTPKLRRQFINIAQQMTGQPSTEPAND